jgi:hypothetical protein
MRHRRANERVVIPRHERAGHPEGPECPQPTGGLADFLGQGEANQVTGDANVLRRKTPQRAKASFNNVDDEGICVSLSTTRKRESA